jgi:hypothetical protein|tara:strand:+ start:173 stop:385 length:213 start_codon:yes stop_codon:yes gene_type:complete
MNEDIKLGDLVRNTKAMRHRKGLVGVVIEEMNGEEGEGSYLKIKWLPTTMDRYENGEHIWYKRKFLAKVE